MKTYQFTATQNVEAETLQEAWSKFSDNSFDFASSAEVEEVSENGDTKIAQ